MNGVEVGQLGGEQILGELSQLSNPALVEVGPRTDVVAFHVNLHR